MVGIFFLGEAFKAHLRPRSYVTSGEGVDVRLVLRTDGTTRKATTDFRLSHT